METLKDSSNKKKRSFIRAVILAGSIFILGILIFYYFSSPYSRIRSLRVVNSTVLSDEYVLKALDLDYDDILLLVNEKTLNRKAGHDPFLGKIRLQKGWHGNLVLFVEQSDLVGWQKITQEDGSVETRFILSDGTTANYDPSILKSEALLPYFGSLQESYYRPLCSQLGHFEPSLIYRISEIRPVSFTCFTDMVECLMDDGVKCYFNVNDLSGLAKLDELMDKDYHPEKPCILFNVYTQEATGLSCEILKRYIVP